MSSPRRALPSILLSLSLLACASQSGAPTPAEPQPEPARAASADAKSLELAAFEPASPLPVEADDARLGSETPRVTVVAFLDFQCPYCAEGFRTLLSLSQRYEGRDVRFVFKHLPLESHRLAIPAAIAGQAVMQLAGSQAFFEFAEFAFNGQAEIDFTQLATWAEKVGVTRGAYNDAVSGEAMLHRVARDAILAQTLGVSSTPTFFINGLMVSGAQAESVYVDAIEAEWSAMADVTADSRAAAYAERVRHNTQESLAQALLEEDPDDYLLPVGTSATLGPKDALVTIVMFSDYECPYCKRAEGTMEQLRQSYKKDVRFVFKHHPLPFHQSALPSARLAEAVRAKAGDEAFFAVSAELFAHEGPISHGDLVTLGKNHGLSDADLEALAGHNPRIEQQIEEDGYLGDDVLASGTPHFFINGKRLAGARPLAHFQAIINAERERAQKRIKGGVPQSEVYASLQQEARQPGAPRAVALPASAESGPSRGPLAAPVTVHIFSDFQCPYCKRAEETLTALDQAFPGQLRFVWHNLPLEFHDQARPAARAAIEAFRQQGDGGFWKMHDALFGPEGEPAALSREQIIAAGKELKLNLPLLEKALDQDPKSGALGADEELASSLGIRGTPAFVIGGYLITGARDLAHFQRVVRLALRTQAPPAHSEVPAKVHASAPQEPQR